MAKRRIVEEPYRASAALKLGPHAQSAHSHSRLYSASDPIKHHVVGRCEGQIVPLLVGPPTFCQSGLTRSVVAWTW